MRANSTARSNFSGSSANPGAKRYIAHGMAICIAVQNTSRIAISTESTRSLKRLAASAPSSVRMRVKSGMKAAAKAPSANRRRKKLGSLNATKNASATGPAPSTPAIRMSRAKPRTRLARV